ncbi:uroporphyrinogen decarboxylase family protein [bacterium]|nr:uroporphyrinogen decarboxylase family protein [bacterium]
MDDPRSPYLFPVDLERFWADDAASRGKPFSTDKPQVPLGISMPATCIWDELGLPMPQGADTEVTDPYQVGKDLRKRYNEKALAVVGKSLFPEDDPPPADSHFPAVKGITDIFEAPVSYVGGTGWVMPAASTPAELEALLDRVGKREVRSVLLPANWEAECRRIYETYGKKPRLGGGIRGPVTAAMSIYGVENLIFLVLDAPELAARFRDLLCDKIIEMTRVLYEVSETPDRRGFGFSDDNSAMLNPDMYAFFGQPILRRVFETFSPGPKDARYQHSDSAMGHLMPLLNEVGLNGANFGPTVRAEDIRQALPRCVIHGQLAPWTFARGTDEEVAWEVRRDLEAVGADGGLVVATAGSINPGSRLSGLRAAMSMIQQYGRHQPF